MLITRRVYGIAPLCVARIRHVPLRLGQFRAILAAGGALARAEVRQNALVGGGGDVRMGSQPETISGQGSSGKSQLM